MSTYRRHAGRHGHGGSGGFSLIELMVAMTLGLLVIGVAATGFLGHTKSAQLGQALVDMQTRARFALDEIAAGVRSAGYIGCASAARTIPALPERLDATAVPRASWRPVDGFVVTASTWVPADPAGYGAGGYTPPAGGPATPVPGSDALLVEGGTSPGGALADSVPGGRSVRLSGSVPGIARGSAALVGNCAAAEVFHVERVVDNTDGTSTARAVQPLDRAHLVDPDFPLGTRVLPYRRALYFVGDTGRVTERGEPIRALYEHLHPFADNPPAELAHGVEAMVVRYRQREPDGTVHELGAGAADFDPERVVGVRAALLLSQEGYRPPAAERAALSLAGVASEAGGAGPGHPEDSRMRRTFERSVAIRARSRAAGS